MVWLESLRGEAVSGIVEDVIDYLDGIEIGTVIFVVYINYLCYSYVQHLLTNAKTCKKL
jgi:hypothetical protein